MRKTFVLRAGPDAESLRIEGRNGSWTIHRGGEAVQARSIRLADGRLSLLLEDGRQVCGRVLPRGRGEVVISTARGDCRVALADPLQDRVERGGGAMAAADGEEEICALMPGRVVEVPVHRGDRVEAGMLLLVLEAMKMQNEIRAERPGVVGSVSVAPGDAVEAGARMLTIQSVSG